MKKVFIVLALLLPCLTVMAQEPVIENRPYADFRTLHWGFYVGMTTHDMSMVNNGHIDPATGEQWYADVDSYSPGFTVGVLGEWRINKYLALRFTPGISFGQKHIGFHEQVSGRDSSQTMRSNLIVMPLLLKVAAPRYNNFRPYVIAGLNPAINMSAKTSDAITVKTFDCYFEIGMGCDIYLRYFKLIPELKFSFGLMDILQKDRPDLIDSGIIKHTNALDKSSSRMVTLSFYFE